MAVETALFKLMACERHESESEIELLEKRVVSGVMRMVSKIGVRNVPRITWARLLASFLVAQTMEDAWAVLKGFHRPLRAVR
ncbi:MULTISPECIES: hypothetical protein [unclassified Rhizobium]|uniref:hypothetical protein n=1 Tax=unclassified Rhizobium TaxID=2613769 RepID=UPI003806CC98